MSRIQHHNNNITSIYAIISLSFISNMGTHGGDEVAAIVVDVGSSLIRAGYGGEDVPRCVMPSVMGYIPVPGGAKKKYAGITELCTPKNELDLTWAMRNGEVADWDVYEDLIHDTFSRQLHVDPAEHPFVISESPWQSARDRERIAEIFFEKFNAKCIYLAKTPVLSSFACCRHTALVVDIGADVTSVTPVYDGFALKRGIQKQEFAGRDVSAVLERSLEGQDLTPNYCVASKTATKGRTTPSYVAREWRNVTPTESFHRFHKARVIDEAKIAVLQTTDNELDEVAVRNIPTTDYEFPTGYSHAFGLERFLATEAIFNPIKYATPREKVTIRDSNAMDIDGQTVVGSTGIESLLGLTGLVLNSLEACDVDIRPTICQSIILTGGGSRILGLGERLQAELASSAVAGTRYKLVSGQGSSEREFSSWTGGSILGSLGTFQQMWFSHHEYNESGASLIAKKCP